MSPAPAPFVRDIQPLQRRSARYRGAIRIAGAQAVGGALLLPVTIVTLFAVWLAPGGAMAGHAADDWAPLLVGPVYFSFAMLRVLALRRGWKWLLPLFAAAAACMSILFYGLLLAIAAREILVGAMLFNGPGEAGSAGLLALPLLMLAASAPVLLFLAALSNTICSAALGVARTPVSDLALLRSGGRRQSGGRRWLPAVLRALSSMALSAAILAQAIALILLLAANTMAEMGSALNGAQPGPPVAPPPSLMDNQMPLQFALATAASVVILLLGFAGSSLLLWSSRRLGREAARDAMARDPRPPILFLRSFRDDQVALPSHRYGWIDRLLALGERRTTLDHILIDEFAGEGPIVAIGRPGDEAAPYGAARIYVSDDDWQATVSDLAERARLIVLIVDSTEGVKWEVSRIVNAGYGAKTLLIASPGLTVAESPRDRRFVRTSLGQMFRAWPREVDPEQGLDVAAGALDDCFALVQPYTPTPSFVRSGRIDADAYRIALRLAFRETDRLAPAAD